MHTFTDPADGERYVGAYVGVDVTQRVFACFDQVDLKAPITLSVVADPAWTLLANGRAPRGGPLRRPPRRSRSTCSPCAPGRGTASPGSTAACRWAGGRAARWPPSWTATRPGCAARPRPASTTSRELFDEPFPFDSYDQVFVPG